jgi:hypothetical protein
VRGDLAEFFLSVDISTYEAAHLFDEIHDILAPVIGMVQHRWAAEEQNGSIVYFPFSRIKHQVEENPKRYKNTYLVLSLYSSLGYDLEKITSCNKGMFKPIDDPIVAQINANLKRDLAGIFEKKEFIVDYRVFVDDRICHEVIIASTSKEALEIYRKEHADEVDKVYELISARLKK